MGPRGVCDYHNLSTLTWFITVITFCIISPEELKVWEERTYSLEHLALKITGEFCCCMYLSWPWDSHRTLLCHTLTITLQRCSVVTALHRKDLCPVMTPVILMVLSGGWLSRRHCYPCTFLHLYHVRLHQTDRQIDRVLKTSMRPRAATRNGTLIAVQTWVQIPLEIFSVFSLVCLECQMGGVFCFGTILWSHSDKAKLNQAQIKYLKWIQIPFEPRCGALWKQSGSSRP